MTSSIESALLIAHLSMSLLSITLSLLLVFIVFRHTPSTFATFAVMLKCHALIDLYVAVGSSASMQRIIPIDWSIVVISHGPCEYIGATACYLSFMIFFGGESCFFHSIAASFAFRLMVIRGKTPTARQAFALFCVTSLPAPLICSLAILAARDDDEAVRSLLMEHLHDDADVVTGFLDVRSLSVCIVLFILIVLGWPLFAIILYLRSQILTKLDQHSSSISEKSRIMQRKLLAMLTAQSAVPLVQLYFVAVFILGFLEIFRNPALELSGHLVSGTTSFLSPLIVFYSIDQYKRAVLNVFRSGNKENTATVVHSCASKLHVTPSLFYSREYDSDLSIDYPLEDAVTSTRLPLTSEEGEPTSTTRASTDSEEYDDEDATSTRKSLDSAEDAIASTLTTVDSEEEEIGSTVSSKPSQEDENAAKIRMLFELANALAQHNQGSGKVARPKLSSEIAGKKLIKTHYGAYLRAWAKGIDWYVGAANWFANCKQWIIEEHGEKVALKNLCGNKYLRSNVEWYVDLADIAQEHELWTPVKNDDSTWSFKSHHGTYLRAQPHGRVSMQVEAHGDEQFRLEEWTEPETTTTSTTTTTTTTTPSTTTEASKTMTSHPLASGPVNEVKTNVTIVFKTPESPSTTTTTPTTTATTEMPLPISTEDAATPAPGYVNRFSAIRDSLQQGQYTIVLMFALLVICLVLICTTSYMVCRLSRKILSRTKSSNMQNPVYEKVPLDV